MMIIGMNGSSHRSRHEPIWCCVIKIGMASFIRMKIFRVYLKVRRNGDQNHMLLIIFVPGEN